MTRLRGWAPRGHKLLAKVPQGRWHTLTFLAALRHDRIEAPCVIDGPINGESFLAYVEQVLVPTLKHGDIVIMDNLGSHKGQAGPFVRPGQAVLPAALQSRSQPYRTSLCKAQNLAAKSRRANRRGDMAEDRNTAQRIPTSGMRQLPQKCRIRFNLDGSDSSAAVWNYRGAIDPHERLTHTGTVVAIPIMMNETRRPFRNRKWIRPSPPILLDARGPQTGEAILLDRELPSLNFFGGELISLTRLFEG